MFTETLGDHIYRRSRRGVLATPEPTKPVVNEVLALYQEPQQSDFSIDACTRVHPLIDAVGTAFGSHYPLSLSPDAIWLVIAQGFSHHLSENAEAFRDRLVRHQGRQKLTESVLDLSLQSFQNAVAGFSGQIREATDPVLHETLICDFSTTTPTIRTASEVVLMDTYSSYFEYEMQCICGIPQITIEGSVEDWERIRSRVEVLETFDLGWWVSRLRPILDEFIQAVSGRPNREFWQAIYKPRSAYASTVVTGWIADLFPYLNDAPNRLRNPILQSPRDAWSVPVPQGVETRRGRFDSDGDRGIPTESFPSGLSSVPVVVTFPNRPELDLDLVAGFMAIEQSRNDLSLAPVISWSVNKQRPATPILI
jgi:hypothetical protein